MAKVIQAMFDPKNATNPHPECLQAIRLNQLQDASDACYQTSNAVIRATLLSALDEEGATDKEFSMFAAALIAANRPGTTY